MVTPALMVYLGVLAAIAVERLVELRVSKRNAALAFEQGGLEIGAPHVRVMTALHALWFVACAAEPFVRHTAFIAPWSFVFLALAIASQGLRWWAIGTLGPRWNVRIIVVPGAEPVTGGPYRFVRHPNYLAVITELACVPLIHTNWVTALVFSLANAALLSVRIRAEEQALGGSYAQAFAHTRRFVPGARHD
ncbi:MAG: isoprenylcysteine carboxyl methyltransferase family protein [Deltaproteobacteria bacterium]|nr:isoprenylcysteine carboxyl methyltransferase family protein [Deltaproteobacteria bacterium]